MSDQVQLVSDGDGVAVIGPERAVEDFLRSASQWESSRALDLRGLSRFVGVGAELAQAASEIAANSGRWIKLTEESAGKVKEWGLMPSKTAGQSHLMIGAPGTVKGWLQAEQGAGSMLTNPAALSGLGGVLAQAAMRQTMAEIVDYLVRIDVKVDDVLRKIDDTVEKDLVGAMKAIERALKIRDRTGSVSSTSWSTVDQTGQIVESTDYYALKQLEAIAAKLESTRMKDLASATTEATREVPKWLAVLARSSQLDAAFGDLYLDRLLFESPLDFDGNRSVLENDRQARRAAIADRTADLLSRMDAAVGAANASMVWTRAKSIAVVASANQVALGVDEFQELLNITAEPRSWDPRQLGRGANFGSRAIQQTKDKGPIALAGAVSVASVAAKVAKSSR